VIKQKDLKLLWGRAGNRCAKCRCKLSEDMTTANESFPLGQQAHIVADVTDGPRGRSVLTLDERDAYHNLILLCPNCHVKVDNDAEGFPVEKLHMLKSEHELWVERTLAQASDSKETIAQTVYGHLIDAAVDHCRFREWQAWTGMALSAVPNWTGNLPLSIFAFRNTVIRAVWPGTLPELENAIRTLSIVLNEASNIFLKHAIYDGTSHVADRFYHSAKHRDDEQRLVQEYEDWRQDCYYLIFEATKAANWFAEVVRRDINPMFFALEGKFVVTRESWENAALNLSTMLLEYSQEERKALPDTFCQERTRQNKRQGTLG